MKKIQFENLIFSDTKNIENNNYNLIDTLLQCKQKPKDIVDYLTPTEHGEGGYRDYLAKEWVFCLDTAEESLSTLIKRLNLKDNYYVFKKKDHNVETEENSDTTVDLKKLEEEYRYRKIAEYVFKRKEGLHQEDGKIVIHKYVDKNKFMLFEEGKIDLSELLESFGNTFVRFTIHTS